MRKRVVDVPEFINIQIIVTGKQPTPKPSGHNFLFPLSLLLSFPPVLATNQLWFWQGKVFIPYSHTTLEFIPCFF